MLIDSLLTPATKTISVCQYCKLLHVFFPLVLSAVSIINTLSIFSKFLPPLTTNFLILSHSLFFRRLSNRSYPGLPPSCSWSRLWPYITPPLCLAHPAINDVLGVWLPSHVPVRQR